MSAAHAVLAAQCDACHVKMAGVFSAKASDQACLACHDGPIHHANQSVHAELRIVPSKSIAGSLRLAATADASVHAVPRQSAHRRQPQCVHARHQRRFGSRPSRICGAACRKRRSRHHQAQSRSAPETESRGAERVRCNSIATIATVRQVRRACNSRSCEVRLQSPRQSRPRTISIPQRRNPTCLDDSRPGLHVARHLRENTALPATGCNSISISRKACRTILRR